MSVRGKKWLWIATRAIGLQNEKTGVVIWQRDRGDFLRRRDRTGMLLHLDTSYCGNKDN